MDIFEPGLQRKTPSPKAGAFHPGRRSNLNRSKCAINPRRIRRRWPFMTNGLPLSAGVYAVSGSGMTLFGWILSDIRLIDWFGNGITMKANTALGSFAAGLALLNTAAAWC